MNAQSLLHIAPTEGDHILEIGFGSGQLLDRILKSHNSATVAGIDISPEMVAVVSKRLRHHIKIGRAEIKEGGIESIPFAPGYFTKLCSVNTLYFWSNPVRALAECHRVLQTGGKIILCFNAKKDMLSWPGHKHGFRLYEVAEVADLLMNSGFGDITLSSDQQQGQGLFHCISATAI
ncbi:class I SAM-dependent methyltransferase [Uliginosibacterium gangwonense]|uniref:class I SAM-dependent methyltransferase n=1 Tax=Uliginosibacterium gangwonense TaxID=392736 RepID=UPI0012F857EE|nr:class I SAM-dependent methyltransferase [Uliginosibacterium gangwonense]